MQKVQIRVKSKEFNTHYTNRVKTTKVSNTTPQVLLRIIKPYKKDSTNTP